MLFDGRMRERVKYLWRAFQSARVIHRSGMFDPAWYGRHFCRTGPGGLLLHYVLHGAAEGRSPSAIFDGDWYASVHPEIGMAGLNPLAHYVTVGRQAGYKTQPAAEGLSRQALSDDAYGAWLEELGDLRAPGCERITGAAGAPPELTILHGGEPDVGLSTYLLFLPDGVRMSDAALPTISLSIARSPDADVLFADEDQLDDSGARHSPWFKPGFDPELMLAGDLTGPATVMRRSLLHQIDWDGRSPDAAGLRNLCLRAVAFGCRVTHIPAVLFHRPRAPRLQRVFFASPEPRPLVSVIIPTRDQPKLLQNVVNGVLNKTAYAPIEVLIVDNGSREPGTLRLLDRLSADRRVRVLKAPGAFNWSALNNQAARLASGHVLVLLNDDVDIVSSGWLDELVAQATRPEIGIVGAKLLYSDRRIQHIGLSIDAAGCFCHVMRDAAEGDPGHAGEMAVTRSVAAVTGACLAIRREVYRAVGGLEESVLQVTGNDIDLCLRVRKAGFRVVVSPASVLVHHEAASRGHDRSRAQMTRVLAERDYLRRQWGAMASSDPYLNANLCLLNNRPALEAPTRIVRQDDFLETTRVQGRFPLGATG